MTAVRQTCAMSCSDSVISGFSCLHIVTGERIVGGHDDGQQIRASAVAVHEDLPDQRAVNEHRFQFRDGDELALRELQHVVAAVEIHELIRSELGHDVAGAVVAVGVEHVGGDFRPLVVTGEHGLGLDQQLTPGVGLVGEEVAEVGNVDQLVVDHRRALHLAVDEDRTGLGGAISVSQMDVEQGLDECPHLCGDRRGARHRRDEPPAEEVLAQVGQHVGLDGPAIGAVG